MRLTGVVFDKWRTRQKDRAGGLSVGLVPDRAFELRQRASGLAWPGFMAEECQLLTIGRAVRAADRQAIAGSLSSQARWPIG